MKHLVMTAAMGLLLADASFADGHRNPAPDGASAYIVSPADGATVANPVTIVFGLEGMGVAPAGTEKENTGHHHLLINTDPGTLDMDASLPATDEIVHFGGAPIAAVEGVRTDDVERAGNVIAAAFRKDQQQRVGHALPQ